MGAVIIVLLTGLFGWLFLREGLLSAAMMLVAVFLGAAAGLGFGPGVATLVHAEAPVHYAMVVLLLGLASCGLTRALLVPINQDIDFPALVDRCGGLVLGMTCGALVGGFLCVWLLCLNLPALSGANAGLERGAAVIMRPCAIVARMTPGRYPLHLQTLLDRSPPPAEDHTAPQPEDG